MKGIRETFKSDHWVMPYLLRYRRLLLLALFLGVMTFFAGGALMFNSGYLISKAATHPYNILMIYVPIVLARAFGIARPVFRYAERLTSHNWVLRIVSSFRKKLYLSVQRHAVSIRQSHQTGDLLGILAEDIDHIENLYLRTVFPIVIGWVLYAIILIGIGVFNWAVALMMALLLGFIVFVIPLISVAANGAREFAQREVQRNFYVSLTDAVLGLGDWLISGRHDDFMALHEASIHEGDGLKRRDNYFQWWRDFLIQLVFGLAIVLVLTWTGMQFTHNQAESNWVAAFTLALFPIVDPFSSISQGFSEWPIYQKSIERVNALDDDPIEMPEQQLMQGTFKQLAVDHVTFAYEAGSKPVVHDLSLTVHAKDKIALLGPSGTGKSTLLKLILGDETATDGSVTVNGQLVATLQDDRAQIFGVLDQQPYLFNTTVLNNVRLGNLNASDEEVESALKQVQLWDLISHLPKGMDTEVSEAGSRFSGGERQRLALARILLQDAPVIILDEPTVSLDPITERELLDTVFDVLKDKTIIWVTHHLQGIEHVNQVLFLEHGAFDMVGDPHTLYRENERFKGLYDIDWSVEKNRSV